MPFYHRLGEIPHKRHTQFRKPDGSLFSGDQPATVDDLKAAVQDRLKASPGTKIYLRADANAEHKHIKKVLNAMASIGVDDFIFGVFAPEPGGAP